MKLFKSIALFSILAINLHAETLDEALAKTKTRFEVKAANKAKKDSIKAKYKTQIDSLKKQQKEELNSVKAR